jgi:predicted  nucleic acid-binding Zn-ribbon protein
MPHQCTDCGRAFEDGSKEMLSGCPDCGGTTFQFRPKGTDTEPESEAPAEAPDPPEPPGEGSVAQTVGSAATAVRDLVGSSPAQPDPESSTRPAQTDAAVTTGEAAAASDEDAAQASARSDLVSTDELSAATDRAQTGRPTPVMDDRTDPPAAEGVVGDDRPGLADLRAELNDQFESIKVLEPGQYELNLMELYDREEYIIALQEDGKYTIQMPERWEDD